MAPADPAGTANQFGRSWHAADIHPGKRQAGTHLPEERNGESDLVLERPAKLRVRFFRLIVRI